MPQPQTNLKVETITLTTEVTDSGDKCVNRHPRRISKRRSEIDVIRVSNANPIGSNDSIRITVDPTEAGQLFDPVPPANKTLAPGESIDWTIRAVMTPPAGMKFRTDPDTCKGSDQDDITIGC